MFSVGPIGQGAERSRAEPLPSAGPSEGPFGQTLLLGVTSEDSGGCQQRLSRLRPWPGFFGRVPLAALGSPISITPASLRMWMFEARLTEAR
jgi:hypothetical protein